MRSVNLAKVAAQAEILRLKRQTRRTAFRAGFAAVAGVFLLAFLTAAHVVIVMAIAPAVNGAMWAVLIVGGGDLLIAVVMGALAMRNNPGRIEREAEEVKETALAQLRDAMAMTALVGPVLRMVGTRKAYGLALAALTARYLGGNRH